MAWPDDPLAIEATLELDADLIADPNEYLFATDITSYVFDRSGDSSIVIQRGRTDEMSQAQPSTIDLVLNNSDGRFSPRNPVGAYYPDLRRNTPIRVRKIHVKDTFTRTASSSWGTSDSGDAWTSSGGSASDYSVSGGKGNMSLGSVNVGRYMLLGTGSGFADSDMVATVSVPVLATGANIQTELLARFADTNNYYALVPAFKPSGGINLKIVSVVAGVATTISSDLIDAATYTAGASLFLRFQVIGSALKGKIWNSIEPAAWMVEATATDFGGGLLAVKGVLQPGNTNTLPVVVTFDDMTAGQDRSVGFVSEWPPRWDLAEVDFHVPIRADGVLRRLSQGATPLKSASRRRVLSPDEPTPLAYWPCEDQEGATSIASGLLTGSPMLGPTPHFASGISGSDGALDLNGVAIFAIHGPITLPSVEGFQVEATVLSNLGVDTAILNVANFNSPTPWSVSTTLHAAVADGLPHHYAWRFAQNGADIDVTTYRDGVFFATVTPVTATIGNLIDVAVPGEVLADQVLISHIAVYSFADMDVPTTRAPARNGHAGEISGTRFARLCAEESVPDDVTAGSTEAMGPQLPKTLLDLLRECEAAEEGLIVERATGELGFDPHSVRENQAVALTLNYATGKVSQPFEPTDDDQRTRNDVTVTREGGSSARSVDESGPVGVVAVGRYDEGLTLNLYTDDQPAHHAGWRVNLGTVDGLRFPTVTVNLRRNDDLVFSWLALDIGDRIQITNMPDDVSYDTIDLIVEGYTEQISQKNWIVTFNCAPYKPYGTFELADTSGDTSEFVGRLIPDNLELIIAATSGATTFTAQTIPKFTVDSDDYPMELIIGGEMVSATAGAVVTPSFVAAGAATHADNASLTPALPAGVQAGDLLLVFAAIRSSGTGVVADVTEYTAISNNGNIRLFARLHDGNEAAPTVTFTGGSAGDTTSAQMAAFRGVGLDFLFDRDILNGSAADIITPALALWEISDDEGNLVDNAIILQIAWKQDDWTSVTSPAGFTEIGEPSSTTGNDQGITWAYQIQTTATGIAASSFVVTGGTNQISRSTIVALRSDVINLTVTRSVNGVTKAHAKGAQAEINEAGLVLAL